MREEILTSRQKETLDFIKAYISRLEQSPTVAEIGQGLKLKSLRSVTQHLESLERKGAIRRNKFKQRSIVPIETDFRSPIGMTRIPVIASAGCDAASLFAEEQYDEFLSLETQLVDPRKTIVAIKASGGSMVEAGIHNGDYVLVEVTEHVALGDRVVALLGDMAVIKRFHKEDGMVMLYPEAAGYDPIIVSEENAKIFGKVLSVLPGFSRPKDMQYEYDPGFNKNT